MSATAVAASLADVLSLRHLYLHELHAQCRYDAVHSRGWAGHWRLLIDDRVVGYAAIKGLDGISDRDALFEWYVTPPAREASDRLWETLVATAGPEWVECQTNDPCLYTLARRHAAVLTPTTWLFEAGPWREARTSALARTRREDDSVFGHDVEPVGDIVLEVDGTIVATGGAYTHYNPPYADVFMEVAPDQRRRGHGTHIVAEVMRTCWLSGHVPAARCAIDNLASRATLLKAGMREVGQIVVGRLTGSRPAPTLPR